MALFTFRHRGSTVPELIARRRYREALDLLKEQLRVRPEDRSLRLQSADVLVLMGMTENATRVLSAVADEFAAEGFAAKAVAVLKKIQRLEPDRRDVEKRLVALFKGGAPATPVRDEDAFLAVRDLGEGLDAGLPDFPPSEDLDIGFDAGGLERIDAAGAAVPGPESAAHVDSTPFEQPSRAEGTSRRRVVSPLFDDLTEDEMVELVRGLELLIVEPGDIVVTEGEPGDSLYVITTGVVKAFVRDAGGRSRPVRRLREGDFFGEISVLSGTPRTATITAAGHCEMLRLDRTALDEITRRKPSVRGVLERFYEARVGNAAEPAGVP